MKKLVFCLMLNLLFNYVNAQVKWINLDSLYQPLLLSMHVYQSTGSLDGKPNVMYYAVADLEDKDLQFTSDTSTIQSQEPLLVIP